LETIQGKQIEDEIVDVSEITLICILRAGLFVSLGVRSLFKNESHEFHLIKEASDIQPVNVKNKHVVLIDSVINTGETIMKYLNSCTGAKSRTVISIVMQNEFKEISEDRYSDVNFYVSRISTNSFVGHGSIDTGNRLFGTY
jgi:uracil phosphoribosyltransferase